MVDGVLVDAIPAVVVLARALARDGSRLLAGIVRHVVVLVDGRLVLPAVVAPLEHVEVAGRLDEGRGVKRERYRLRRAGHRRRVLPVDGAEGVRHLIVEGILAPGRELREGIGGGHVHVGRVALCLVGPAGVDARARRTVPRSRDDLRVTNARLVHEAIPLDAARPILLKQKRVIHVKREGLVAPVVRIHIPIDDHELGLAGILRGNRPRRQRVRVHDLW